MSKDFKEVIRNGKTYSIIRMDGVDDLVKDLHRMAEEMTAEEGQDIAAQVVKPIAYRMEARAPVYSGLLRDFIRTTKGKRDRYGVQAAALAGFNYRKTAGGSPRPGYALQVEYGAQGKEARPFIRPAFDGYEQAITDDIMRRLRLKIIKWKFNKTVGRIPD